jgi:hypothetical protein
MKRQTVAQQIEAIVRNFDVSGERVLRGKVERRHGSKGFGYYAIMDVAYEGQRVNFFRNLAEAQAWAQEMQEAYS